MLSKKEVFKTFRQVLVLESFLLHNRLAKGQGKNLVLYTLSPKDVEFN